MPARWMKQPNGKLARFSTVVDCFTHYNYERDDAIEVEREDMGRQAAIDKVERGMKRELDAPLGWNESIETIRLLLGEEKAREAIEIDGWKPPP